jgi:hypothetical protein
VGAFGNGDSYYPLPTFMLKMNIYPLIFAGANRRGPRIRKADTVYSTNPSPIIEFQRFSKPDSEMIMTIFRIIGGITGKKYKKAIRHVYLNLIIVTMVIIWDHKNKWGTK